MEETGGKPSLQLGWLLLAIIAAAGLMVLAYLAVPAFHNARIDASYRKVLGLIPHSQSEKIPAAVVSEDRHMDPHFESDLRAFVPSTTRIMVTVVAGDREAFAFAQEIAAWLRANGWQHVQGVDEHKPRGQEHLIGTNLQVNPKGGMELIVGPRPKSGF
jgi:hypothetical protein